MRISCGESFTSYLLVHGMAHCAMCEDLLSPAFIGSNPRDDHCREVQIAKIAERRLQDPPLILMASEMTVGLPQPENTLRTCGNIKAVISEAILG